MDYYKSKRNILLIIDMLAITISFLLAIVVRYWLLIDNLGSVLAVSTYATFFAYALLIYVFVFLVKRNPRLERQSYKEIIVMTVEQQIIFVAAYIIFFFLFHKADIISRVVVATFFVGNATFCSIGRILYHNYCIRKTSETSDIDRTKNAGVIQVLNNTSVRHVYLVGSKSIGMYGGYESFVMNLLQQHEHNSSIKYHVACKANGSGFMNLDKLPGATRINDREFVYCNSHCFLIDVPEKIGAAQAIFYDLKALKWCCDHIEKNHITRPIVYIMASRIGPFEKKYVERIHDACGLVYQNPDGREDWRRKWNYLIRKYWKFSERYAVKNADLVVCDSRNIQKYIKEEYSNYRPCTTFIAYGARIHQPSAEGKDQKYLNWLADHNLTSGYYMSVGRFVEENNFEIMIREFMLSHTRKDFAIITTDNSKYAAELQQKLHYKKDQRIKFVGTVYDIELLEKIRTNAYGYFHGHEVGGTNPSLLESLGSTKLNLIYDVGFNREVAGDAGLYWNKEEGNLAGLIDKADRLKAEEIADLSEKAKQRIRDEYSWEYICGKYADIFAR